MENWTKNDLDPRAMALLDNWCDAVQDALDGDEVAYPGAQDRVPAWMVLLAACSLVRRTEADYLQAGALDQIDRVLARLETLAADEGRWSREIREIHRVLDAQAVEALSEHRRRGPIRTAPGPDPTAERLLAIADRIDLLVLASCELAIRDAARHPDREDLSPEAAALLDAAVTTALRLAWNSPELSSLHEWYSAHYEMLSVTALVLARPRRAGWEKTLAAVPDRRALGLAASPISTAITCLDDSDLQDFMDDMRISLSKTDDGDAFGDNVYAIF